MRMATGKTYKQYIVRDEDGKEFKYDSEKRAREWAEELVSVFGAPEGSINITIREFDEFGNLINEQPLTESIKKFNKLTLNEGNRLVQPYYYVYAIGPDGIVLDEDAIDFFTTEKAARKFAEKYPYSCHIVFVPMPNSDEGPEYAEYIEEKFPYRDYEIVDTFEKGRYLDLSESMKKSNKLTLNEDLFESFGRPDSWNDEPDNNFIVDLGDREDVCVSFEDAVESANRNNIDVITEQPPYSTKIIRKWVRGADGKFKASTYDECIKEDLSSEESIIDTESTWEKENQLRKTNLLTNGDNSRGRKGSRRRVYRAKDGKLYYKSGNSWAGTAPAYCWEEGDFDLYATPNYSRYDQQVAINKWKKELQDVTSRIENGEDDGTLERKKNKLIDRIKGLGGSLDESLKEGWESIDGLKFTRTGVHGEKLDDDWIDYKDYLVNKNRLQDEMLRDFKEENGYTRADEDREEFWNEFDEFIAERGLEYLDKTVNESLDEDLSKHPYDMRYRDMLVAYRQYYNCLKNLISSYTDEGRKVWKALSDLDSAITHWAQQADIDDSQLAESIKEDLTLVPQEPSDETPATPEANGVAKLILDAINDESDTIKMYNDLIANTDNQDIIDIIQDITAEENNHLGMLQKALEIVSPNASNIEGGQEEAQGMIADEQTNVDPEFIPITESNDEIANLKAELRTIVKDIENGADPERLAYRKNKIMDRLIQLGCDDGWYEESLGGSLSESFWFGKYVDVNGKTHKVYFKFEGDFEEAEEEFNEIIPEPYTKSVLSGQADEPGLKRDGFTLINEHLTEDLHDKFKRDIKNTYKEWAKKLEQAEAKRKEALDFIPADATEEQIEKYKKFIDDTFPLPKDFKYDFPHNIEKDDFPFYVTYYAEYPIWEPAEGGYYYAGNDAIWSEGFNTREEALDFARQQVAEDDDNWEEAFDGYFILRGKYIGENQTLRVEPRKAYLGGIKGWEPYQ